MSRRVPITKTLDEECEEIVEGDETGPTVEGIREAQLVVGELVWLVTHSQRGDLLGC